MNDVYRQVIYLKSEDYETLVCAKDGVEAGTERAWKKASHAGIPSIFFVNKLDDENADFSKVIEDLREKFKEETVSRMQMIHKQFTYLTKIASKRSVDYTQEDVEKMFAFLENEVASSKKEFLRKFNDDQNHFNFTW